MEREGDRKGAKTGSYELPRSIKPKAKPARQGKRKHNPRGWIGMDRDGTWWMLRREANLPTQSVREKVNAGAGG